MRTQENNLGLGEGLILGESKLRTNSGKSYLGFIKSYKSSFYLHHFLPY